MSTNDSIYKGLKPAAVWQHFAALNDIPRQSHHEEQARAYVQRVAEAYGADFAIDDYGNIVVYVDATHDEWKNVPVISLQSHLDMVCQSVPTLQFDPLHDTIIARRDGDRIYATGTTLGADNGIGASLMLALLTAPDCEHGALELLFTVEEETGLTGAVKLNASLLKSQTMINLDSTSTTEITVGCAGGEGVDASLPLQKTAAALNVAYRQIQISGLTGGHSGIQIHEPRANAIKLLAKVLLELQEQNIPFNLCDIHGGSAHNAIPRDAAALIAIGAVDTTKLESFILKQSAALAATWHNGEPDLSLKVLSAEAGKSTFDEKSTAAAIKLLNDLPHGVYKMSARFVGKVETSCNLSNANIANGALELHISSRSLIDTELNKLQEIILDICHADGAKAQRTEGYPGWEPRDESRLSDTVAAIVEKITGQKPIVEVIHAGVECGVIASKIPDLDVISIGAELYDLHSPDESVVIPSVEVAWNVVRQILEKYTANM